MGFQPNIYVIIEMLYFKKKKLLYNKGAMSAILENENGLNNPFTKVHL